MSHDCVSKLELSLKGNEDLGTRGIQSIAQAIAETPSIVTLMLDFSSCALNIEQMRLLAEACAKTSIINNISLILQSNSLTDGHIEAFFESLKQRKVGKPITINIDMKFNNIKNHGLLAIADFLRSAPCLDGFYLELGVNENLINHTQPTEVINTGCEALAKVFQCEHPPQAKIKLYDGCAQKQYLFPEPKLQPSSVSIFKNEAGGSNKEKSHLSQEMKVDSSPSR